MTVIASLIVIMLVGIRVIARAIMRVYMSVRMRVEMRVIVRLQKMKSCTHGFMDVVALLIFCACTDIGVFAN